jgi:hypothetical protein
MGTAGSNNFALVNFAGGSSAARSITPRSSKSRPHEKRGVLAAGGGMIDLGPGITNTIAAAMKWSWRPHEDGLGTSRSMAQFAGHERAGRRAGRRRLAGGERADRGGQRLLSGSGTVTSPWCRSSRPALSAGEQPRHADREHYVYARQPGSAAIRAERRTRSCRRRHQRPDQGRHRSRTLGGFDIDAGDWTSIANGTSWRLFNYSRHVTKPTGLAIRTAPTLGAGQTLQISTATANQVNVVVVPKPVPRHRGHRRRFAAYALRRRS